MSPTSRTTTVCLAAFALFAGNSLAGLSDPVATSVASASKKGKPANQNTYLGAISDDGRYAAFVSPATNVVKGGGGDHDDLFVRDLKTGKVRLVTRGRHGAHADGNSYSPSISKNGRFIAFSSGASNLVANDSGDEWDVFVFDRVKRKLKRLSIGVGGAEADGASGQPVISRNGRFVAFRSMATNLVPAGADGNFDNVYVADRKTGAIRRATFDALGGDPDGSSAPGGVSDDGRFVAFASDATDLVLNDMNGKSDVFVRDMNSNATELISGNGLGATSNGASDAPVISADGSQLAYRTDSSNTFPTGANGKMQVLVVDRSSHLYERASDAPGTVGADQPCGPPSISSDGRFVVFATAATNLTADVADGHSQVFVRNRDAFTTRRVSFGANGAATNGDSGYPSIAKDSDRVLFQSNATNLVDVPGLATAELYLVK